jgi:hypothetical protein
VPARRRLLATAVVGLVVAGATAPFAAWQFTILLGWCGGGLVFVGLAG